MRREGLTDDDARAMDEATRRLACTVIEEGVTNLRRLAEGKPPTYANGMGRRARYFAAQEIEWATRDNGDEFSSLRVGMERLGLDYERAKQELRPLLDRLRERYHIREAK